MKMGKIPKNFLSLMMSKYLDECLVPLDLFFFMQNDSSLNLNGPPLDELAPLLDDQNSLLEHLEGQVSYYKVSRLSMLFTQLPKIKWNNVWKIYYLIVQYLFQCSAPYCILTVICFMIMPVESMLLDKWQNFISIFSLKLWYIIFQSVF